MPEAPTAPRPQSPRLAPLGPDQRTPEQQALLDAIPPELTASNVFTTLVRHPKLFAAVEAWRTQIFAGVLSQHDRELATLRAAWHSGSDYEFSQHVPRALAAGFTQADIDRVLEGPDAPGWDPFDATIVRAVDELKRDSCISDATWAALAERYDEEQLVELPFLVGSYTMLAYALNSLGVQRES